MPEQIKEKLLTTIEQIPKNKLGEVLNFMEFLLEKEHRISKKKT